MRGEMRHGRDERLARRRTECNGRRRSDILDTMGEGRVGECGTARGRVCVEVICYGKSHLGSAVVKLKITGIENT
jgi:hypothetical protein